MIVPIMPSTVIIVPRKPIASWAGKITTATNSFTAFADPTHSTADPTIVHVGSSYVAATPTAAHMSAIPTAAHMTNAATALSIAAAGNATNTPAATASMSTSTTDSAALTPTPS